MGYNVRLLIAYDGSHYKGWQRNNKDPSIEETLQRAIESVLQHSVQLQAASRTDAGVHAHGQVANFFTPIKPIDTRQLAVEINLLLPSDMAVLDCQIASENFHPTLAAKGKEYHYYLCLCPVQQPHLRFYSWHYPYSLDITSMREGAKKFIGRHNFLSFCNVHPGDMSREQVSCNSPERELNYIAIDEIEGNRMRFVIGGKSFLYKMVRNIVGTLVHIGSGKIPLERLPQIIAAKDRRQAGITAPAHGLFLKHVEY